jgi:D-alanyl-D-alanine dipeptidase
LYDSALFIENGKGSSLKEEEISAFTNVNKVVRAGGQDKTTASIIVIPNTSIPNTPTSNTPVTHASITNIPVTKAPITSTHISNIPTPTIKSKEKIKEVKSLVELIKLDNSFVVDIKYATKDNFTKKVIYSSAKCIINKNTAVKLIKANNEFKKIGYRIKIYDAYRPYSAQKILWDAASDKSFVANPKNGSNHNRGAAVDLTLVDKYGKDVSMPSGYDEFTKRAKLDYKDCPKEQINNRELLGKIMVKCGFNRIKSEWWHFDDTDAKKYPVLDIPFSSF